MVLWEITLGTAYFLGLKRTYKLALKLQRRLFSPNHPKIQQFLHRRTRAIFDMALRVHLKIQERDLEVGRNVGNWILRWLDRMKPSAQIRAIPPPKPPTGINSTRYTTNSDRQPPGTTLKSNCRSGDKKSDGRVLFSSLRPRSFPTFAMMMRPPNRTITTLQYRNLGICGPDIPRMNYGTSISTTTQYRNLGICGPDIPRMNNYGTSRFEGVIRKDIMQWMLH